MKVHNVTGRTRDVHVGRIFVWTGLKIRRRGQARPKKPTAGMVFFGRGSQPPNHQLEGLEEHCKLLRMVWGRAPTAKWLDYILRIKDMAPDTSVVVDC